jgi:hypothetical protein
MAGKALRLRSVAGMIDGISALSSAFIACFFVPHVHSSLTFSEPKPKKNGSLSYRLCVRTF